jgi:hypothetical protein
MLAAQQIGQYYIDCYHERVQEKLASTRLAVSVLDSLLS